MLCVTLTLHIATQMDTIAMFDAQQLMSLQLLFVHQFRQLQ
jgi:hypothetical protein